MSPVKVMRTLMPMPGKVKEAPLCLLLSNRFSVHVHWAFRLMSGFQSTPSLLTPLQPPPPHFHQVPLGFEVCVNMNICYHTKRYTYLCLWYVT